MPEHAKLASVADQYYSGWENKDRAAVQSAVTTDLEFRSPLDDFDSAEDFLEKCFGPYSGFKFEFKSKVYGDQEAFFAYEMTGPSGPMPVAEHLTFRGDKISAIRVYFGQKQTVQAPGKP